MLRQILEPSSAKSITNDYEYVLLRELSRIYLGTVKNADICWDEITEARFFNEHSELRFWQYNGSLRAVVISDSSEDPEDSFCDKSCKLEHNGAFGSSLTVREYFEYDEDGQLQIVCTRLKGWVK